MTESSKEQIEADLKAYKAAVGGLYKHLQTLVEGDRTPQQGEELKRLQVQERQTKQKYKGHFPDEK